MTATQKIDQGTLAIISTLLETNGSYIKIAAKLPRLIYLKVDAVLTAMGGKWDRKAGAHVFREDPEDVLNAVIAAGEVTDVKKALNQFFTPRPVARDLVARAKVDRTHRVLEPSAGDGAIVRELVATGAQVWAVEIDERLGKGLSESFDHVAVQVFDFLAIKTFERPFDRIVMNPPFAGQADVDHITRAFELLAPGGKLVSVASAGVFFRKNPKTDAFRKLVDKHGSMEPLPSGSFQASGTNVETFVIEMRR